MFYKNYIIFDIETTGLNPNNDQIIEIGALKYKNNKLIEEFNFLIKPTIKLPNIIKEITKITDEMLSECQTIEEVLPIFLTFIEDLPILAYNINFDITFINQKCQKYNFHQPENTKLDVLYLARKYIRETPNQKLETLKNHFNIDSISHRAIGDCNTTNMIYEECKKRSLVTN